MRHAHARRSLSAAVLCALLAAFGAGVAAAPAGAVVAEAGGHGYGVTPIESAAGSKLTTEYRSRSTRAHARRADELPFGGSELENVEGGPVMHAVTTHVVYWDPGSAFTSTTKKVVEEFFLDVAHDSGQPTNTFAVAGQYTDATGHAAYSSTFGGVKIDKAAYPTSGNCTVPKEVDAGPPYTTCIFDGQLQSELSSFIEAEGLPTGSTQLYFVLLPHNVATCLEEGVCSNNFYCAYHSWISPGPNEIIYADIPFSLMDTTFAKGCQADGFPQIQLPNGDKGTSNTETRFADVALKYMTHEYIEAATDPLVNAPGQTAWVDERGFEIGDKCNSVPFAEEEEGLPGIDKHAFSPTLGGSAAAGTLFDQSIDGGHFYLQSEWDNAAEECLMQPVSLGAGAFAPPSGTTGAQVAFNGSAFDPYAGFEPTWSFGDGATGTGASIAHAYTTPGDYTVTMTPRDALTGSTGAPVSHAVSISAPSTGGGGGGGGGGGTGGGGGSTGGGSTGASGTGSPGAGGGTVGTAGFTSSSPTARLAGSSAKASSSGVVKLQIACAAGGPACAGTVTLRGSSPGGHAAKAVTLGSASFTVPAGRTATVTVHLSSKARAALAHKHSLHVAVAIVLRVSSGAPRTVNSTLTIHLTPGGRSH